MKLSNKALMYSLFVFPGAGYFYVKRMKQGYMFALLTLALLSVFIFDAFSKAQKIVDDLVRHKTAAQVLNNLDILQIREQLLTMDGFLTASQSNVLIISMIVIWLVGVIDIYRIGKQLPKE